VFCSGGCVRTSIVGRPAKQGFAHARVCDRSRNALPVAALVGCGHRTVKSWLERERSGRSVNQRSHATDPYLLSIRGGIQATRGTVKSKPLLRVLRATRLARGCSSAR
jgi:hypothetical protein